MSGSSGRPPVRGFCTRTLQARSVDWGAVLDNTVPASGFWRSHQQHEHITLKELRAVR
jgi:hypothetical protein